MLAKIRCFSWRGAASFIVVGLLAGCAQHNWTPGPGMSLSQFEPEKAECSLVARNGGTGFYAYGNAKFVAGATLGHAIGESIRAQADFNNCMSARGWHISTPESVATTKINIDLAKAAAANFTTCLASVRGKEQYVPLSQYFSDSQTGKHNMTQLALDRIATPTEAKLFVSYTDEAGICIDSRQAQYERVSPELGTVMRSARASADAETLLVVQRKQTWSSYFVKQDGASATLQNRLKTIYL